MRADADLEDKDATELNDELELASATISGTAPNVIVDLAALTEMSSKDSLYLANELVMEFTAAEAATPLFTFTYSDDADSDETSTLNNIIS